MLTHASWSELAGLRHGFCERDECSGRSPDAVVAGLAVPLTVVTPRQVHGARVVRAHPGATIEADGLVTEAPGQAVGVVTADCAPVLLVARDGSAAAAVHAGWRGAAAGVLEAAVAQLGALSAVRPADLRAAVGPAVGPCCYEVGDEVLAAFRGRVGEITAPAWSTRLGRLHLDLRRAVERLLTAAGISDVALVGPCTACDRRYASYRRDGAGAGRQLSFIGFVPPPA